MFGIGGGRNLIEQVVDPLGLMRSHDPFEARTRTRTVCHTVYVPPPAETLFTQALEAYKCEDWGSALAHFKGVLDLDPTHQLAQNQMLLVHESLGDQYSREQQPIRALEEYILANAHEKVSAISSKIIEDLRRLEESGDTHSSDQPILGLDQYRKILAKKNFAIYEKHPDFFQRIQAKADRLQAEILVDKADKEFVQFEQLIKQLREAERASVFPDAKTARMYKEKIRLIQEKYEAAQKLDLAALCSSKEESVSHLAIFLNRTYQHLYSLELRGEMETRLNILKSYSLKIDAHLEKIMDQCKFWLESYYQLVRTGDASDLNPTAEFVRDIDSQAQSNLLLLKDLGNSFIRYILYSAVPERNRLERIKEKYHPMIENRYMILSTESALRNKFIGLTPEGRANLQENIQNDLERSFTTKCFCIQKFRIKQTEPISFGMMESWICTAERDYGSISDIPDRVEITQFPPPYHVPEPPEYNEPVFS